MEEVREMEQEVLYPNIRSEMAKKGIHYKELIYLMEKYGAKTISISSLSNKLNGKRGFSPDEMLAISKALNKDMYFLFFNIEYTKCIQGELC